MEAGQLKKTLGFLLVVIAFFALPLVAAGTIYWPEAWIMVLIYLAWALPVLIWLGRNNPELLKQRMDITRRTQEWDKLILILGVICYLGFFVIPGLDFRFGWSEMPVYLEIAGFVGMVLAFSAMFLVMRENTYLSRAVEVQEGQKVITTGPYKYVRHPLYAAMLVYCISVPVSLGSYYGIIPALGMVALMLVRTSREDKFLHENLPGYEEYAQKTRYRLVPGVW
ncbi:MAG: isoprenylcysteine carboxylmethyltransferase family protein [Candidatus ainarchaeum sp.]|nr:isoprenylcysteine carboxylmethyltransferase family protein [Candidatus ainarchaeum sp.]MDD5096724.1 isoprenylcysteine carboxylmethyltransferase family protein [Candidatus ainarchaeum sp.]